MFDKAKLSTRYSMNIFSSFAFAAKPKTAAEQEPLQTLGGEISEIKQEKKAQVEKKTQETSKENKKSLKVQAVENVGGQAVIEGIMMRYKDNYALAVRLPNQEIYAERRTWNVFSKSGLYKKTFFRGFPILIETLINGVKTLNRSAELNSTEDEKPLTRKQLFLTLLLAGLMALGLFIILPHGLSYLMQLLNLSGDVQSFSFQIWDGFFKFFIFFCYLAGISFLPDVRRVLQYHGAEHKVIAAYEKCPPTREVDISFVQKQSRLHARCGTTFLLFVLSIAIFVHSIALPPLLWILMPETTFLKHFYTLLIKISLTIPISALAYELIRTASKMDSFLGALLKAPGFLLQLFTTVEPTEEHIEVALVALKISLGDEAMRTIVTPEYTEVKL